ncbi:MULTISPECIES: hypothetical protein [Microbacterium]|uniref:hypothetical protein n=1 Tax=Microbacterium TaxID=33882 RepID=UPI001E5E714F|nr:hypothetical protein [Microbacterium nymphoidis]MCD2496770.1 hypothetical protein [Microbacterium nymphoidis]
MISRRMAALPAVPAIPVPPFATREDHDRYLRMLQLHLALLDDGGPALGTIALSAALEAGRRDGRAFPAGLSALELTATLTSWFPVAWTLDALAAELVHHLGRDAPTLHRGRWHWFTDPDFLAEPAGAGWRITRHERGGREEKTVSDDQVLIAVWVEHFRAWHSYPLAWRVPAEDMANLAPATAAVRRIDAADAALPYRAIWRAAAREALRSAGDERTASGTQPR